MVGRLRADAAAAPGAWGRRALSANGRSVLLLAFPVALLVLAFVLPLSGMVVQSLQSPAEPLATYGEIATNPALYQPLLYTLGVAVTVTAATLLLAYPVALIVSGLSGGLLNLALALIVIPFWTSTVIRSYAWIILVQRRGVVNDMLLALGLIERPVRLIGSDAVMQIAMVHLMLPFMVLPLLNALRGIDPVLVRAASVLGANPLQQFLRVTLVLSLPGISAGCALVFISTLGFYVTPALLGGSSLMVAVLIEQQASRLLNWPLASALGTLVLLLSCALFLVYERTVRAATGRARHG